MEKENNNDVIVLLGPRLRESCAGLVTGDLPEDMLARLAALRDGESRMTAKDAAAGEADSKLEARKDGIQRAG